MIFGAKIPITLPKNAPAGLTRVGLLSVCGDPSIELVSGTSPAAFERESFCMLATEFFRSAARLD